MAPMFVHRADVPDSCSTSDDSDSCSPNADSDASSGFDPSLMNKHGPHRYIGIGMVAGLILIIFLVWLYRGRWPRKKRQQYCCCCSSRSKQPIDDETPPTVTRSPERDKSTLGGSEQRLVKEMVVFTKVPNAFRGKERYPMEWEMNHVNELEVCIAYFVSSTSCDADSVRHERHHATM
jgi:hypothetical protein